MRQRWLSDIRRIAARALANGGERVGINRIRWDISQTCTQGHVTELYARPSRGQDFKSVVVKPGSPAPICVELITPCRKCEQCLTYRARLWTARAIAETQSSVRTWLGTLTLSPESLYLALTRASASRRVRSVDFAAENADEQFRLVHSEISKEITKYLKRVRKQSNAPLRYLLVCEKHQSGAPHYHILIHEYDPGNPVRHKTLKSQWQLGFSDFKLVPVEAVQPVRYVVKYLTKSSVARVRASLDYGTPPHVVALSVTASVNKETGSNEGGKRMPPPVPLTPPVH